MAGGVQAGPVVVMPMWKRATITGIQLVMTMLTAGVIIGYGQFMTWQRYPLLIDSKVYQNKCKGEEITDNTCDRQTAALDQLFNIGASVSIFVQAPSGVILDFLGPRITCWAGLMLFIPGCFLFAFAGSITAIDAYMIGFQLLSAGGPFVFISSLPVAQLWPDKQAMILMMINGVYGGGAFVFFLFAILYNHLNISMKDLFIGYGILGVLIVVVAGLVWPRKSYHQQYSSSSSSSSPSSPSSSSSLLSNPVSSKADDPTVLEIIQKSWKDIQSWHYVYLAAFIAFLIFKSNFFLSTYNSQFALYMSDHQQTVYSTLFGVILPGIGILAGPIGLFFDKFGANPALLLVIFLSSLCSLCGLTVFFSHAFFSAAQIIRMIVFSIYYPMIYGVWAFVLIGRYGNVNFGVLYGIIAVFAGIVNLIFANMLNRISLSHHSYVFANALLAGIGMVFVLYPLLSLIRGKLYRNKYASGYYEPIINS